MGDGIGATQDVWAVMSPTRAAGSLPIITVVDALEIMPGPAGIQPGSIQGIVISVLRAAGILLISTLGWPFAIINGKPGCGMGVGLGAGGCMGAWQCGADWMTLSVILAAGAPMVSPLDSSRCKFLY